MEYCPEVAILESAFQLVAQQAGKSLATIEKTGCHDYTPIIHTAVEEICTGLESDRDEADMLLWQQNIHTLVLYSLVQKRYIDKDDEGTSKDKDRVPVCSTLDILAQTVPNFSCHFYFEIMKLCNWEPLFFESLHHLAPEVSVPLLHDAIQHTTSEPMTPEDQHFITVVTDELLSSILCVPVLPNPVTEKLLLPVCQPRRFVRLVHYREDDIGADSEVPNCDEDTHAYEKGTELAQVTDIVKSQDNEDTNDESTKQGAEIIENGDEKTSGFSQVPNVLKTENVGTTNDESTNQQRIELKSNIMTDSEQLENKVSEISKIVAPPIANEQSTVWAAYLEIHSDLSAMLLEHIETAVNSDLTVADSETLLGVIGKLLIFGLTSLDDMHPAYLSLILNLWGEGAPDLHQICNKGMSFFCLNTSLVNGLSKVIDRKQWAFCVYKILTTISDMFAAKQSLDPIHIDPEDSCSRLTSEDSDQDKSGEIQELGPDNSSLEVCHADQRLESVSSAAPFDTTCDITVIENLLDAGNLTDETTGVRTCAVLPSVDHCRDLSELGNRPVISEEQLVTETTGTGGLIPETISKESWVLCVSGNVNIVGNLYMDTRVVLRMLQGCLSDLRSEMDTAYSVTVEECLCVLRGLMVDAVMPGEAGIGANISDSTEVFKAGRSVVTTEGCWEDVTLEALCWRIQNRIPPYNVCVEKLVSPSCLTFWESSRLYEVLQGNVELLAQRDHILRLIAIQDALVDMPREITIAVQQLMAAAFTELPFHDQDYVAMVAYVGSTAVAMTEEETSQLTVVFNRITVERDDEILSELLLLCLRHPAAVLRTAVEMCVKNDEQATNLAQVLQYMYEVCRSRHSSNHPDTSIVCHVITEYLTTTSVSDKEQKHFNTFIQNMMQPHKRLSGERKPSILSPQELLHSTLLPYTCVAQLLDNRGPISCKFALTLMKSALECGCDKYCDWSEFEPMGLVLCLAEIMQECLVLWDHHHDGLGFTKISVRQLVSECLVSVGQLVRSGFVTVANTSVDWFLAELQQLHWLAGVQLSPLIEPLVPGLQMSTTYDTLIQEAVADMPGNLVSVLMCVGLGADVDVAGLADNRFPTYEDMITALIQVLPNLLCEEFLAVTEYIGRLVDLRLVPVCYRLGHTVTLPLDDLLDVRRCLGTSQLLRDTLITLACVTDDDSHMLQHTLQGYVANIKMLAEQTTSPDLRLFLIGQLFQHVCDVTASLPSSATDSVLVLLLHMLTEFKVITMEIKAKGQERKSNRGSSAKMMGGSQNVNKKMVKCLTYGIEKCIQSLSDESVEKEMLLKKLQE